MPVTAVPRPTGHPGYSETLPREAASAAVARRLVRTALTAWQMEELVDDASLVITELVSNAVDHTRFASIRVIVNRPSANAVHLGVVDRSKVLPVLRLESGPAPSRGLLIVDALTTRWGVRTYRWGKQVWAELRTEAR